MMNAPATREETRTAFDADAGAHRGPLAGLALAAIGIVFGDIGTSPLYTLSTVFDPAYGLRLNPSNLLGVISLIVWSLIVVVSLKYVTLIMRANNRGEGGIMALLALAASSVTERPRLRGWLLLAGVFGAALFFGDSVITPAISVLSAVEGLEVAAPHLKSYIVPIALAVLITLFLVQRKGTAGIGTVFGPVMTIWFGVLGLIGLANIVAAPQVLAALNPLIGLGFLVTHGWLAFVSLGALALNYLGQGALLLAQPGKVANPFFHLFPGWALVPMIALATVATVIASQAVISGAYSMTKQAIQLGFLPNMSVVHTSAHAIGQIYVPAINWMLLVAVVFSVLGFGSSPARGAATGFFVVIDVAFFSANLLKLPQGGWYPLLAGGIIFTVMSTWNRGRELMREAAQQRAGATPLRPYLDDLFSDPPQRVGGTAVFLTIDPDGVPHALLNNLEHNGVLHDQVLFVNVAVREIPYVKPVERLRVDTLGRNCWRIVVNYGFKDDVNLPEALRDCALHDLAVDPHKVSYFLSHAIVVARGGRGMAVWRERMFATMSHNTRNIAEYLKLPANRVMEVGSRVEI